MRVQSFRASPSRWDTFVRSQAGWTHFHLHAWKTVMERALGHECFYLCAVDDSGELAGVLPLVQVKSCLFGHFLVSMPFLNYGGPLGSAAAVKMLAETATDRARSAGAKLLELRSRGRLGLTLPVSHRKITVVLPLPDDPETLWNDLGSKVRSQVRRPRKEGVEVVFGPDQLAAFYRVFARHMRDLGTPVLPRRWFEIILETFGEEVWFGCAYLRGEPVAAGAGFEWAGEFEMTWASALHEHSRIAANMLLYWTFINRAIEEGLSTFNFGRCTPGSGTHTFKRQWGGHDEMLWWYHGSGGGTATTPSLDDDAYSWGPRLWRHLPLPMANALGPRIVRYIP